MSLLRLVWCLSWTQTRREVGLTVKWAELPATAPILGGGAGEGTGASAPAMVNAAAVATAEAMSNMEGVARAGGAAAAAAAAAAAEGNPGGSGGKPLGSSTMLVPQLRQLRLG